MRTIISWQQDRLIALRGANLFRDKLSRQSSMFKMCKQKLIFLDVCNSSYSHFSLKPRGTGANENSITESFETAFYFKLNIAIPQCDAKLIPCG